MPNSSSDMPARWSAAFAEMSPKALAALYTRDALFYGSTPALCRGPAAIEGYFSVLPKMNLPAVAFSDVVSVTLAPEVVALAALATFSAEGFGPVSMRLTWTLMREDGEWKIASHHVSPAAGG